MKERTQGNREMHLASEAEKADALMDMETNTVSRKREQN